MKFHRIRDVVDRIMLIRVRFSYLGFDYFDIYLRLIKRSIDFKKLAITLACIFLAIAMARFFVPIFHYLYGLSWTGFESYGEEPNFVREKTLWDWLDLLIIPFALGLTAYLFRKSETKLQREQALDDENETALLNYFDYIEELLSLENIDALDIIIANARSQTLLRRLEPERKSIVIKFLHAVGLISYPNPLQIQLSDLSRIDLSRSFLPDISLRTTRLDYANFEESHLNNALLSGCSLRNARFERSNLNDANLEYAILNNSDFHSARLSGASLINAIAIKADLSRADLDKAVLRDIDLKQANLRKATLTNAYLFGAQLKGANLKGANLTRANLTEANLMYANLKGADFTNANLTNAIVSMEQLEGTKSYKDANLKGIKDRLASPRIPTRMEIRAEAAKIDSLLQRRVEEVEEEKRGKRRKKKPKKKG